MIASNRPIDNCHLRSHINVYRPWCFGFFFGWHTKSGNYLAFNERPSVSSLRFLLLIPTDKFSNIYFQLEYWTFFKSKSGDVLLWTPNVYWAIFGIDQTKMSKNCCYFHQEIRWFHWMNFRMTFENSERNRNFFIWKRCKILKIQKLKFQKLVVCSTHCVHFVSRAGGVHVLPISLVPNLFLNGEKRDNPKRMAIKLMC